MSRPWYVLFVPVATVWLRQFSSGTGRQSPWLTGALAGLLRRLQRGQAIVILLPERRASRYFCILMCSAEDGD